MTTLHLRKSIARSPLRRAFLLMAVALTCFGLSTAPKAFGVTPPPDGGYLGNNTAEGDDALFSLGGMGTDNTAIGYHALHTTTGGYSNTATGSEALYSDTTGYNNTATGNDALESNTIGAHNTASGYDALESNTTGYANTATGDSALLSTDSGYDNTAAGYQALNSNTSGHDNVADGFQALYSNTGSNNIALGSSAGISLTTGSNNIDIGNTGVAADGKTIRIGTQGTQSATYVAGIYNVTAPLGTAVYISSSGQLGTVTSSARFKRDIRSMDKASETILALRPVTFRYKAELDPAGVPQFGLVAEDVEKVNPDLVARDAEGKVYTVRYEAVNAMLLNEFLKEHRTVQEQGRQAEEQEATIAQLKKGIEVLTAQLHQQALQIQKVSADVELNKLAPQMADNNR